MAEKIKKKAKRRFANLFSVLTVSKKKASNKDTKTDIRAIPSNKSILFIYAAKNLNKYNILVLLIKM
nr:hypothetical protein [uncultured Flavobacterium sp.]